MWPFKKKAEIRICSETDDSSLMRLNQVLNEVGAELIKEENSLVGSQETTWRTYRVGDSQLDLEIETYVGVTISGEEELLKKFVDRFRGRELSGDSH